jgi:hypothetical protein
MAPPATCARANWAIDRATSLPEIWALLAKCRGVVGARQLMRVCKAARAGAREFLNTLPGLVVCGGVASGVGRVSDVWRLDMATLRCEPMSAPVTARAEHACCAVRGALVVIGGTTAEDDVTNVTLRVEMLSSLEEGGAFVDLPPLSCGKIRGTAAVAVDESGSVAEHVLLLGGVDASEVLSTEQLVDLATGACVPKDNLLHWRASSAAGRLPDGRVVCVGDFGGASSAEEWGAPAQGTADAAWGWRELPAMSVPRYGCCGCVMSDGRFAVLGGESNDTVPMSSC